MLEELIQTMVSTYGPLGLLAMMIIQTIIVPISSEAVLIFASMIGIKLIDVIIYGGVGLIIGAVYAFYVGKYGGKPIVNKLLGEKWINRVDGWTQRNGFKAILFARIVPVIPFDLVSYMSGLTKLKFRHYFLATAIGAFPRCLILAIIGLSARDLLFSIGVSIEYVFYLGIVAFLVISYLDGKGYLEKIKDKIVKKSIKKTKE
jgi:uncharacterized membrane protein YdjX (TVP38/TMEM64 family)